MRIQIGVHNVGALAIGAAVALSSCGGNGDEQSEASPESHHQTRNEIIFHQIDPQAISIQTNGAKENLPAVSEFSISEREITQEQFEELLGQNPSSTQGAQLPVDRVTLAEAKIFCKVLTDRDRAAGLLPQGKAYRLPTRSEWLMAAFPRGEVPEGEMLDLAAWHGGNSGGAMHPTGEKAVNAYGLFDMLGNASELVERDGGGVSWNSGGHRATMTLKLIPPAEAKSEASFDPDRYILNEVERFRSNYLLKRVTRELNLIERWNILLEEETIELLLTNLRVTPERGTDLVEVSFAGEDPETTRNVVDTIIKTYKDLAERERSENVHFRLQELELEEKVQEHLMEDSRAKFFQLIQEHGNISPGAEPEKLAIATPEKRVEELKAILADLDDLEGGALIEAAAMLGLDLPVLKTRYPEYQTAKLSRTNLEKSGLGAKHPKRLHARKTISLLEEMLASEIEDLRKEIKAKVAQGNGATASENRTGADSLKERRAQIALLSVRDQYELHKDLLAELKQRVLLETLNEKQSQPPFNVQNVSEGEAGGRPPFILGGTARSGPKELLDLNPHRLRGRTSGVGFRLVMADE